MNAPEPKKLFAIYPSPVCKTYGVIFKFNGENQVHYEIEVSYLRSLPEEFFLFELNKKQVYINEKAPDKMVDRLADEMGKVLYPLTLKTNRKGLITEVMNAALIRERWQAQKEKINAGYQGEVVDRGINTMDQVLVNELKLMELIRKDWFFALFFSGIYGLQPNDSTIPVPLMLPFMPFAPMATYAVTKEITERHSESKSFTISYDGLVAELWGTTKATGSFKAQCELYHQDFTLRSITGEGTFALPDEKEKEIHFEIYHLAEKDKMLDNGIANLNDKQESKEVKKSFWNIFK